ncbi:ArgS-related anticodon-binding protein NrtL [Streptomyces sp. NPDC050287]|uniref:ArgS-related anticodon-binding protein NrtL n=1 Tax=Streptomyces sp. NPDC050287 TaxID=3365608 RepID=UPI0037B23A46
MTPVELSRTVLRAVRRAVDAGELSVTVPERVVVTPPGPGGRGDYATNIALQLARPAERTPRYVAEVLRGHLLGADGVDDVAITGPGFLNISLLRVASAALVEEILSKGHAYGHTGAPSGPARRIQEPQKAPVLHRAQMAQKVQESVLRLRAADEVRAVVVADAVARLLRSQGTLVRVTCEGRPQPGWQSVLGVRVDADARGDAFVSRGPDSPAPVEVEVRPVPAPADPLPLGRDAGRWALLHPAAHDRPRIGDEHLVQREGNPLFRVRYAHARIRALSRNAADLGFHAEPGDVHPGHPRHPGPTTETAPAPLLTPLADHPRILAAAAAHRAPDRLARHLVTVADAVLPFLVTVLPRGEEKPSAAHRARLALAEVAGTVLAGGLALLGIDAPDHL